MPSGLLGLRSPPTIYQSSRCFVTYARMGHLDPAQVPRRGKPWATILEQDFVYGVDVLFPEECADTVTRALVQERPEPKFSRVVMRLEDVLDGPFFTDYIKRGNVLMLSEGRTTVENVFSLRDGTLTIYLDKESYERAGIAGKPYGVKGKRGEKSRWIITCDLHKPSMLHGKKAFERLLYACRNVFNQPVTWLFCSIGSSARNPDPMTSHHPISLSSSPVTTRLAATLIPPLSPPASLSKTWDRSVLAAYAADTYEWLSLVRLSSPRIEAADRTDSYVSAYEVPRGDYDMESMLADRSPETGGVCKISWRGFLSSEWARDVLAAALTAAPSGAWLAVSTTGFARGVKGEGGEINVLKLPGQSGKRGEYIMWEISQEE